MQRLFSYRQGDRAEYLAQYILSSFAISVPVPREEDVGSDFHCSLLRRERNCLRPYLPFNIQIKRHGNDVLRDGVSFGGITEAGTWREHEIDQLCQTDTPFLVGIVNPSEQWMEVFTTISRYFVLSNWLGRGKPRSAVLRPYVPMPETHLGAGDPVDLEQKEAMPSFLWNLQLGQPIMRITIADSEDPVRCEEIKGILEPYLRLDQQNGVLFRLGLGYFEWPLVIRPGKRLQETGIGLACGPSNSPNALRCQENLCKIAAGMLFTYKNEKRADRISEWLPLLNQLPVETSNDLVRNVIKAAKDFIAQQ